MLFHITPVALPDGYGEALVPLDLAKAWLRVTNDDEDTVIEALRDAAIDMVEKTGNLHMAPRTDLEAIFETFGPGMRLGAGVGEPIDVSAISYLDSTGMPVMIADGGWRLNSAQNILPAIGTSWPCGASAVAVAFEAGYPEGACPSVLKTAALMFVSTLYVNREAFIAGTLTDELPLGFTTQVERCRMPII